jgi:hypothetical protein
MAQDGKGALSLVPQEDAEQREEATEDLDKLTRHHRKLKSDNGSTHRSNISFVPLRKHRAWHILYDDLPPKLIIENFRQDYEVFGIDVVKSDLMKKLHEGWANSSHQKIKRSQAWQTLFADKTLEEVVREINTIWLDPAYEIRIGTVRMKTVQLSEIAPVPKR